MDTPSKTRRRKSPIVFRNQDDNMEELIILPLLEQDNRLTPRSKKNTKTPAKVKTPTVKRQLISKPDTPSRKLVALSSDGNNSDVNELTATRKSLRDRKLSYKKHESLNLLSEESETKENDCEDDILTKKIINNKRNLKVNEEVYVIDDTSESDVDKIDAVQNKPSELFEDCDVAGQQIFGFKTPKKKDGMAIKASETPKALRTPSVLRTPSRKSILTEAKTPHALRNKIKKKLSSMAYHSDTSGDDFSASGSDFEPDDSESSTTDDEETSHGSDSGESDVQETTNKKIKMKHVKHMLPVNTPRSNRTKRKDYNYVLQSDNYFTNHSGHKTVTSDHTLDRLKNPRLPQDRIHQLLESLETSTEHQTALSDLSAEYATMFSKWMFTLNEGFSILLYGLGSKRNLLQTFHRECVPQQPVLVVNGFFPSLTIKEIVDSISNDILDLSLNMGNIHEIVDVIEEEFAGIPETHLFLIVHNLDGPMLRNNKAQSVLARLAKVNNIHLLASIDHINTPLIWDHSKLSSFNFSWWDVTTFLPYTDETSFESSLMVQNSGALALSSLKNVFLSLTSNCKGIYLLIVKNQLANKSNHNYQGFAFKDLYSACREVFLVSSDLALRAQLTEFLDHKLIKSRRTADGIEHLMIPLDNSLLKQFLDQQE